MEIKLTKYQQEKFETVLWLTDPHGGRGTGRTQLLAMAYIQHSINYRAWVSIVNHGLSHPQSGRELLDRIRGIMGTVNDYSIKIRGRNSGQPSILVEPIPKEEYTTNPWRT